MGFNKRETLVLLAAGHAISPRTWQKLPLFAGVGFDVVPSQQEQGGWSSAIKSWWKGLWTRIGKNWQRKIFWFANDILSVCPNESKKPSFTHRAPGWGWKRQTPVPAQSAPTTPGVPGPLKTSGFLTADVQLFCRADFIHDTRALEADLDLFKRLLKSTFERAMRCGNPRAY